jgi:hypothetical protein
MGIVSEKAGKDVKDGRDGKDKTCGLREAGGRAVYDPAALASLTSSS